MYIYMYIYNLTILSQRRWEKIALHFSVQGSEVLDVPIMYLRNGRL